MTAKERNRGKQASDDKLFSADMQKTMQTAIADLSYLLSRGYAEKSTLQLVGNRYRLNSRQQRAIQGMAASQQQLETRKAHQVSKVANTTLAIDGFNLLIILESALSGAYVFEGLDGCYRDLSGVHGTYKRVQQTERALQLVGETLKDLNVAKANWYFDSPVSNSGRLKTILYEMATANGYPWDIYLDFNPDKVLAESTEVVVSSDAWILDQAQAWFNLAPLLLEKAGQEVALVAAKSP